MMHEFTIAMNVLSIAEENANKHRASRVYEIELDIGELSGVDAYALEFAMEYIRKSEIFEQARLVINKIPGKAKCESCHNEFDISDLSMSCPWCSEYNYHVFQGKELKVKAIKTD